MPIDDDYPEERLHKFLIYSPIAHSNLVKLIQMIDTYNLLDKFCHGSLHLDLVNFNLCKYFKHFGTVLVGVNSVESVDNLNLCFNHCKYCCDVALFNCKLIGDLELDLLIKQLQEDDDTRMEMLWIDNCRFDENNWMNMIEIILNTEIVRLWSIKMKEEEWRSLVDVMEQRPGQRAMKLKWLNLWDCNISDQLVESDQLHSS